MATTDGVELAASIVVPASPAEVYHRVSDPANYPRWSPESTGVRRLTGSGDYRVGDRFVGRNRVWLPWSTTCTVVVAEPGREFAFDVDAGSLPVARWGFRLLPAADGGTEVVQTWRDRRSGVLGAPVKLAGPVVGRGTDAAARNRSSMRTTLAGLARDLAGAAPPDPRRPTVSVIMAAHNSGDFITAAIASVQRQTRDDWELIVIDDASDDGTPRVVAEIAAVDPRVRLIELERNFGAPAGPRNVGIRAARGRWIAILDDDDLWHPQKLDLQLNALDLTGAGFASAGLIDFADGASPAFTPVARARIKRISLLNTLVNTKTPTSTVVVDRELLLRHPFNEDPAYKAREDLDCFLHCHEELGHSIKVMHPLLGYRITGDQQISGSKLTMMKRHYHVLSEYRTASGGGLGPG
ncbi:MAG: hypothetical protein RLZ55_1403, partial [Actinomycetota bacterium]